MKKLIPLLLALLLALTSLSASAVEPVSDEVITVTMAMPYDGAKTDWSDFTFITEMEKQLHIRLECTPYNSEAWETQLTLMLASNLLPDFIIDTSMSLSDMSDLGSQGYFLPLQDLIAEYAPHITAMMEKYPDMRMYSTSSDGNMYTVVGLQESTLFTVGRSWINRSWLENLGLDYPTSTQELYDVLVAFRDQDANGNGDSTDEIPLSGFTGINGGLRSQILNAFGINVSAISNPQCVYMLDADADGRVFLAETTENYKAYLKYMNRLWNENLLDHEEFIQTPEEFNAKAAEERVGAFSAAAPFVAAGRALDYDQNFYWLGGLSGEYQPERTCYTSSHVVAIPYYMLNVKTPYAKEIIQMLDYFYSEEGELVAKYGYEGVNYDMIALDIPGLEEFSILKIRQPEGYTSTEDYRNNAVTPSELFGPYLPAAGTYHAAAMAANAEQLEALLPIYGWGILVARDCLSNDAIRKVDAFPILLYTEEESAEHSSLYTDVSLYLDSMHAQFITGETDIDAGWDEYIRTLNGMRLEQLLAIEQTAYDRLVQ